MDNLLSGLADALDKNVPDSKPKETTGQQETQDSMSNSMIEDTQQQDTIEPKQETNTDEGEEDIEPNLPQQELDKNGTENDEKDVKDKDKNALEQKP